MEENKLQAQMNELSTKLDIILEEIELQRHHRREMEDLKDDLMRVGKDFYETAVNELDQIHDHFNAKDVLHFGKYMLRNVNTISGVIKQLESTKDFLKDASPLIREYIIDFMETLDEFDRKGYFQFINESKNILDKIVTSFSKEDVQALGDNVVTILNTVKNLTQPEILHALNNAVSVYKNLDSEASKEVSYFRLIKELNTTEVKRGLAFAIQFLKHISVQNEDKHVIKSSNIN
ncbi:MAG: hypothetical protein FD143_1472 [Ignavibacteria bacterium]|nr:MAG: hypothetical protein FD143_1472 [Ignavibacteria bacterium]KAF0160522.1 MAG: hypothetical protein FD188_1696 [Ignavibacteria bacterium]